MLGVFTKRYGGVINNVLVSRKYRHMLFARVCLQMSKWELLTRRVSVFLALPHTGLSDLCHT